MPLIKELQRRNVFKVGVAYIIVAWLIAQVSELALDNFASPDWVIKTILFLLVIGFPLALFFAWAFELTPEGLKKEKDVDRSESITHQTGRKLDYIIIAVLVLLLAYFAVDKFALDLSRDIEVVQSTADKSIAVLPFVNMSSDPEQEYFSDGISEELLNVLSKIPGLQVSARTSSFQFKGENLDVVDIGRQLNTGLVLEGSVRKAGPKVRITAQLVDATNGFHLWSETYDRELENIFAVQDEISAAIVDALQGYLGFQVEAAPRVHTAANLAAHEAYLRGRYLMTQSTGADRNGAIREFESALSHDSDYALAHAELAMASTFLSGSSSESLANTAHHVERAMALDPSLAEAHAASGLLLWSQSKMEESLTHFRRAVQINPNFAIGYVWMGNLLSFELGRYNEAFQMRSTAMRLDPLSMPTIRYYVQALIERNRLAEANRELEKIASIFPHVYAYRRGSVLSRGGNISNAILGSLEALRINPGYRQVRIGLPYHFASLGLEKEALAISFVPNSEVLSWLGKPQDAIRVAEARVADNPNSPAARQYLGLALAGAGDYRRARPILEEMWQLSGGRIAKRSDLFHTATAAALIAARRDAGQEDKVGELVAAIMDNVRRYREADIVGDGRSYGADFEQGLALFLSGDRERGLALLDKGMDDGVFVRPQEAYFQSLYDDPGFATIIARQQARQVRERNKVLAIVCTDNPYEAVWQPAEGTCEGYAASGGN
jgi:TolB-like protein/Tfp pilus assembly protein PilF